jgi:PAS domain S-box-containing protein
MPREAKNKNGRAGAGRSIFRGQSRRRTPPLNPPTDQLAELLEQQAATSEILRVIRQSPNDAQPVFDMIAERAKRLCGAVHGGVFTYDGTLVHVAAQVYVSPEFLEAVRRTYPRSPGRGTASARAILTRAIVNIPDLEADPEYEFTGTAKTAGFRSALSVPMLRDGTAIGAITVFGSEAAPFSEAHLRLLQTFAEQAVIAIENVRLFTELESRNTQLSESLEQQTATAEILSAISSSPTDLRPVLETVVRAAARFCGAPDVAILRLDGDVLRGAAAVGPFGEELASRSGGIEGLAVPVTRGSVSGRAVTDRRSLHIHDLATEPETEFPVGRDLQRRFGHHTMLATPLSREGVPLGVILLFRTEVRPFSDRQLELVRIFADQAVIAIENVRLFQELQARNHALTESLEQQTATSDILRVISSSPTDVQPVFEIIAERATKLCNAEVAVVSRVDGPVLQLAAIHGVTREGVEAVRRVFPMPTDFRAVTARVFRERAVVHVADVMADQAYAMKDEAVTAGWRAGLGAPMFRDGQVIGVIFVGRSTPGLFSEQRVELLKTFADQAVIAIENVRLFTEVQERNRALTESLQQQTATSDILRVISSSPTDIQPVFATMARSAATLCEAFDASIFRVDGDRIVFVGHHGPIAQDHGGDFWLPVVRGTVGGRSVLEGRPIQVADLQAEEHEFPDGVENARRFGFHTILSVPLMRDGVAIGGIQLRRRDVHLFTERHIVLLQTFADQAVIAIENVRLFRELEVRNRDLTEALDQQTATGEILRVISSSPTDVQPVFETIARNARRLCNADSGAVYTYDGRLIYLHALDNTSPEGSEALRRAYPREATHGSAGGQAILTGRDVHIPDALAHEGYEMQGLLGAGLRSMLAVPMRRGGTPVGVIVVHTWEEPRPFTTAQIELLRTFAAQAVIAIQNVRLFDELEVRNRDLTEALDQQTATGEILRVISSTPTDVQPVFDTIVQSAVQLCNGVFSALFRYDGELITQVAQRNFTAEGLEHVRRLYPTRPSRELGSSRAILERAIVHIPDVEADPEYRHHDLTRAVGMRSGLYVPMMKDGEPIGVIMVARAEVGRFSDAQIGLLQTFADQAVIAIENVRLFTALEARNSDLTETLEQQTATGEILRVISSSPTDAQPVFDTIAESAHHLCNAELCQVFRAESELLYFVASRGQSPEGLAAARRAFPRPLDRGTAAGRAVLTGSVAQIVDVRADSEYGVNEVAEAMNFRSLVAVPMMREGRAIGAIAVARAAPGEFPERQIELLQTFADQAVIAIENVRLFKELDARNRDLTNALEQQTATADVLRVMSSSATDTQPVFDAIVRNAVRLCHARFALVYRLEDDVIQFAAHANLPPEAMEVFQGSFPQRLSESRTLVGRAIRGKQVVNVADIAADSEVSEFVRELARSAGYRSVLAVPITREDRALGALAIMRSGPDGESDPFGSEEIPLLQTFTDQAGIAIENVRLFTELEARNRDLINALEQQTATADVLSVISASATDTQPVFDAIVRSVVRLCHARFALVFRLVSDMIHFVSQHNLPPAAVDELQRIFPHPLSGSGTLAARALVQGTLINVPDIADDPHVSDSVRQLAFSSGYRSVLALPIMREGRALGALAITRGGPSGEPQPFSSDEIRLLQTFTDQAGIAIENVRLFNELQARTAELTRSVGELQALGEVSQAVSSTLDLDAVLETIVGRAVQLSGSDQGVVYEFDEASQTFHQRATHRMAPDYVETMRAAPIRLGEGAIGRAGVTRAPVQVADIRTDWELVASQARERLVAQGMQSLLAVPLVRNDRLLGGLVIVRRERGAFSPEVVAMLQTFATQSVLAIQNARLFQEIQRQKQYSDTLVETSPVAIVTMDLAGTVVGWNPGAERLFGYPSAEALGHPMWELIASPELREEVRGNIRHILEGQLIRAIGRRARKDATLVDVEISAMPVVVGGAKVGMIAIYHDITELLRAREEAEAANEAKGAFLATMSHEIRTPMNAVIGMSGLLLSTPLTDEQREYAEVVRQSGDALLTVINDILDFSKIEAGRLELEAQPFDLRECVESALDLVASRAAEKGLDLAYLLGDGIPAAIVGDVTRLRQVLLNLLSNAVKFTEVGEVVLSVAAQRPDGPDRPWELTFSVRDTGIGIPPERLGRLFQSFSQIDASTTRRYGGTGLGLAISQRLAEMMGGRIEVTSEVGRGSDFHFTIRAQAAHAPLPARRDLSGVQPSLRGKRVLVVDDNETNRRILTTHLGAWGMPARATGSPNEALGWIRADERFDVAILDMHMPEMDGVALARAIVQHPSAATLPLVLFTSLGRREALGDDTSFAAYLHKPIKPSQLFDALVSVLAEQPVHVAPRAVGRSDLDPGMATRLPLRILLAEDNVVNQKLALRLLAQRGYRADLAGNGLEALDAVERQTYDVVLMDVQMPEMDGLEASREINRRSSGRARPRIIAMTANAMQGDRDLCVAAGMDDYVAKPIRVEELVSALERCRPGGEGSGRDSTAAEAPAAEAPAGTAIDRAVFDRLVESMGGAFVAELIATFDQDAGEQIASLRRTLAAGDLDGFRRAAHSLKSTSESIGANGLAAGARELETAARAGRLEGAAGRVQALADRYEQVTRVLGALRRDLPA